MSELSSSGCSYYTAVLREPSPHLGSILFRTKTEAYIQCIYWPPSEDLCVREGISFRTQLQVDRAYI